MLVQLYRIMKMLSQLGQFLDLANRLDFQKYKKSDEKFWKWFKAMLAHWTRPSF